MGFKCVYRNFNVFRFPLKLVLARFYRGARWNDTFGYWPFVIGCHHRFFCHSSGNLSSVYFYLQARAQEYTGITIWRVK